MPTLSGRSDTTCSAMSCLKDTRDTTVRTTPAERQRLSYELFTRGGSEGSTPNGRWGLILCRRRERMLTHFVPGALA